LTCTLTEINRQHNFEHLMIVYFDVLLIDDESLLGLKHSQRFQRLTDLISCRKGHAELVERQVISFDQPLAASHLRKAFAKCITAKGEGLVLKPDDPYFDFTNSRRDFASCNIKLKKEYIGSFGDVGDLAVVGARYDAATAKKYKNPKMKWTHFYLGCLNNMEAVRGWNAKPDFTVVNVVDLNETLLSTFLAYGNPIPVPYGENEDIILTIAPGIDNGKLPTAVFTNPPVFDVRCFSFDRVGNTGLWSPRFPTVSKIHFDRSWLDTVSFADLQAMGAEAHAAPALEDSQELREWIASLEQSDPRGIPVDAVSQQTATTHPTPSPQSLQSSTIRLTLPISASPTSLVSNTTTSTPLVDIQEAVQTTGPVSSTTTTTASMSKQVNGTSVESLPRGNHSKRPIEESPSPRHEKRRRIAHDSQGPTSSFSTPNKGKQPPTLTRQPLSDISHNSSPPVLRATPTSSFKMASFDQSKGDVSSGDAPLSSSVACGAMSTTNLSSSQTVPSSPPEEREQEPELPSNQVPPGTITAPAKTSCRQKGRDCLFRKCVFLLAPCISSMPLITEDLFLSHGIKHFITDPRDWAGTVTYSSVEPAAKASATRPRKICLVEARRTEATTAFLQRIEEVDLRLPSGARDWIHVYDWRVLEAITIQERGDNSHFKGWSDPWRKYYVGLA
jgi:DNA ligase 4